MRTFAEARAWRARIAELAEHGRRRPAPRPPARQLTAGARGRLERALTNAALPWPANRLGSAWMACTCLAGLFGWIADGPGLAVPGVVVVAMLPVAFLWSRRDRSDDQLVAALAPALESIARSVRSGAGLAQAVGEAAANAPPALASDLRTITTAASAGAGFVAAVDAWSSRRTLPGVRLAGAALALAEESGGPPARPLDGVATSLQERAALQREIQALASQARLSAMVIVLAPLAFGVLAAGVDSSSARFLFTTAAGHLCLAVGIGLDAAGAFWMHRITKAVIP